MATADMNVKAYQHTPLSDPTKQIRLISLAQNPAKLRAVSGSGITSHEDVSLGLACTVSTWDLETAPEFYAISYAWGDEKDSKVMTVSGQPLPVRYNCDYALRQVFAHWPEAYIWIDYICIDQSNIIEKGAQVAVIVEIYSTAHRVCACVGEHDDTSLSLMTFLEQYLVWDESMPYIDRSEVFASLDPKSTSLASCLIAPDSTMKEQDIAMVTWLLVLSDSRLRQFSTAISDFCQRPYWKRLWILQELRASAGKFDILVGNHITNFQGICRSRNMLEIMHETDKLLNADAPWDSYVPFTVATLLEWEGQILVSQSNYLGTFSCSDPRDRVYGTLTLFDWSMGAPAPTSVIVPDYSISYIDLAWRLIQRLQDTPDVSYVESILAMLEINRYDEKFRSSLQVQRNSQTNDSAEISRQWTVQTLHAPQILFLNDAGEICCDLRRAQRSCQQATTKELSRSENATLWFEIKGIGPFPLIHTDAVPLPGDILFIDGHISLLLRPQEDTTGVVDLEVVG